jgi:hypothetical protein
MIGFIKILIPVQEGKGSVAVHAAVEAVQGADQVRPHTVGVFANLSRLAKMFSFVSQNENATFLVHRYLLGGGGGV